MDELLAKAVERRDALRKSLEALDRFIADYQPISEPDVGGSQAAGDLFNPPRRTLSRAERAAAVAAMMDAAEGFILSAGVPLTRGKLLSQLETAGHHIEGGDKNKVLGTNLWRSGRFHNILGVGYWPKNVPIPQRFRHFIIRDSILG